VANAIHFPSEIAGVGGGVVQIFRENHGTEFTEVEAQLFRSKFPMCTSQLTSKFITWGTGSSLMLPSFMERYVTVSEGLMACAMAFQTNGAKVKEEERRSLAEYVFEGLSG